MRQLQRVVAGVGILALCALGLQATSGATPECPRSTNVGGNASATGSFGMAILHKSRASHALNPGSSITIAWHAAATGTATTPAPGDFPKTFNDTDSHIALKGGPTGATNPVFSGPAFNGPDIMGLIIDSLALMALFFLILTFLRRRRPSA